MLANTLQPAVQSFDLRAQVDKGGHRYVGLPVFPLRNQLSQCTTFTSGSRCAGLKSSPPRV
jgi:hypothetical protein